MPWQQAVLRTPLVPVAILATTGIVLDRTMTINWPVWAGAVVAGLGIWLLALRNSLVAVVAIGVGLAGVAALHQHVHRHIFAVDEIGFIIGDEPRLVRLRGRLVDEPTFDPPAVGDPLRSIPDTARTHAVLDTEALLGDADERFASGLVALTMIGPKPVLRAGDGLEVSGWIHRPRGPDNPGEQDYASALLDRRIRAMMIVRRVGDGVVRPRATTDWSWDRTLAATRTWSRRQLDQSLPPNEAAVAAALLLGDGTAMTRNDWQKYIRTGVIHVLAVSGQHLAVLAGFCWFVFRGVGVRRRSASLVIALGLCFYSALAGGRPPVLRSAVMVAAASGAVLLRRKTNPANSLALAWLAVVALNPSDVADAGCQFSFLCVGVLMLGIAPWLASRPVDPLRELIDAARPMWQRWWIAVCRIAMMAYAVTTILTLVVFPLTASRYHLVSPVGILIGPPAVLLASIALVAGFLQLMTALVCPPLVAVVAVATRWSLAGLTSLVDLADKLPYGHFYVGTVPKWWLVGFYFLVIATIFIWKHRLPIGFALLVGWLGLGVAASFNQEKPNGLRVTFMAVGHGGATLIETPDRRAMLVDVGCMTGPDITRRVVAPLLWHRGINRLDEVFITHADLDHFNGLPSLMERFHVGRVNLTPTFASKPTPGVREVTQHLHRNSVPTRIIQAGDRFTAGNVDVEVVHPPATGPPGPENARSLVLIVRHAGHAIALTGDLDLEGRARLMSQPIGPIDVWMAPHHGGRLANPPELAASVRPLLVVSHNATGEAKDAAKVYEDAGADFLGTWPHGAVTITSNTDGLRVETFKTRQQKKVGRGLD